MIVMESCAILTKFVPKRQYLSGQQKMREQVIRLEQETIYGYAWNKSYSLEHIRREGLQYETVRLIEDIVFNIQFCNDIKSMNVLDIAPYHYAKRMEGSLTTNLYRIIILFTEEELPCSMSSSSFGTPIQRKPVRFWEVFMADIFCQLWKGTVTREQK